MSYVSFQNIIDQGITAIIHDIDRDKIDLTINWLHRHGATNVHRDVNIKPGHPPKDVVMFEHSNILFYIKIDRERPSPNPNERLDATLEEQPVIQDKFFWRQIVRELVGEIATPVDIDTVHLPTLRDIRRNLTEFASSSYSGSNGKFHYFGISEAELKKPLDRAIRYIEKFGYCTVID